MLLKQSTARNRSVLMVDSTDHIAGKTGLTLTITASKDGAAFASVTPTVTDLGSGWYNLALTTTHTNTLGDLAFHITGSGADPSDFADQVVVDLPGGSVASVTGAVGSVTGLTAANLDVAVSTLATAANLSTLAGYVDTEVAAIKAKTDNLPADPADASDIAGAFSTVNGTLATVAGYIDTEVAAIKAKTDLIPASPAAVGDIPTAAAVADAVWDEIIAGHAGVGSTGAALAAAGGSGDPWATALPGAYVAGTAGQIVGDYLDVAVSSISGGSGLDAAGVRAAIGLASANLDTQLSGVQSDTNDIQARLPAALVSGRMDSSTGSMAANVMTAAATASDFVTEVTGGGLDAAGMRAALGLASANLDTQLDALPTAVENADALLNRDMSLGTDSGSTTVRTPRQAFRFLRNRWVLSGTALSVKKEDDSTDSWTAVVSTSPGADPISATDPAGP